MIVLLAISSIVILSHPLTFLFLAACMLTQAVTASSGRASHVALTLTLFLGTFVIAAFWPYYPFLDLISGGTDVYHSSNRVMYNISDVLKTIWPTIVGLVITVMCVRGCVDVKILVLASILILIYTYGGVTEKYSYGRIISSIILVAHLVIADAIARTKLVSGDFSARAMSRVTALFVVSVALIVSLSPSIRGALVRLASPQVPTSESYRFLHYATRQYDVVMTDVLSGWIATTYGGKVVSTYHPVAFVPDVSARRDDVRRFFNPVTSDQERDHIIHKYNASYLLLEKKINRESPGIYLQYFNGNNIASENSKFILLDLKAKKTRIP